MAYPYHEENRWIVTDHRYRLHRTPRSAFKEAERLTEEFGNPYAVVRVKDNGGLFYGLPSHEAQNAAHAAQGNGAKRGKVRCTIYENDKDHVTVDERGKVLFDADIEGDAARTLMAGVFTAMLGDMIREFNEAADATEATEATAGRDPAKQFHDFNDAGQMAAETNKHEE